MGKMLILLISGFLKNLYATDITVNIKKTAAKSIGNPKLSLNTPDNKNNAKNTSPENKFLRNLIRHLVSNNLPISIL